MILEAIPAQADPALTQVTLALVVVTGIMAAATVWLGVQTWRSVTKSDEAVREAARMANASERQLPLFESELRLVERQVSAMERQLALQESAADAGQRRAFPVLEVEATDLSDQAVTGTVYYRGGTDPAKDVEIWIWFRERRYRGTVASVFATPGSAPFMAEPVTDLEVESQIPGWALARGARVDAVSWRSGIEGEWWAQRCDERNAKIGMPDRGEWWVKGVQQPGILG